MDRWWQDLRFGARSLLRNPALATLGLLTLALGIGANTAIFSVVNGVLLKPLPFPHPDQFVILFDNAPKLGFSQFSSSPPNFKDWREQNQVFSGLDAMRLRRFTLTGKGEEPEALAGAAVTGDFFRTVGVQPIAGRLLTPRDDRPGGERVVVLSSDLWHRRFGGDPGIVNRQVIIDGLSHTVIGIAPRTFDFPRTLQLWVPLALDYAKEDRGAHYLHVFGRLKPGVSLERAQADMSVISGRLERQYPDQNASWGVVLTRLQDSMVQDIRPALLMLQLAVWVVLLIACTNVANLLLARMGSRKREIAVRAALGAGRLRLARQIVAESVILFGAGGALGLLLAFWGTRLLIALNPDAVPRAEEIGIDGRVLAYTLLVSVVMGAVFGLVPALSAIGGPLYGALREGGRAMASGRRGRLVSSVLVLGEVALALMLLVGAGLLMQSFARLQKVDPGFDPKGVITARLSLPASGYPDDPRRVAFFQQALNSIRTLPGVQYAASIQPLPLSDADLVFLVAAEGRPAPKPGEEQTAFGSFVSPDYFRTMKIPLLKGRLFSAQDDLRSPQVLIVNRTMAARIWPGQDPLGQRVAFDNPAKPDVKWIQVVGVVGDVRSAELAREPEMEIYRPQLQIPIATATLVIRTAADPQSLIAPTRSAIRQLDANLPLDKVQPLEQVLWSSLAEGRFKALLLGIFAALALVLAAVGVYGVVSHSVTQRVHEIGIRVALGARRGEVIRMLIRQGMMPVVLGLAAGLAGAYAACRLLASQLYKVGAADPFTYIGALLVLTAVALLANWLPARRATRVDPLEALRYE
jgi:putative ABC transport system permease protein